MFLEVRNRYHSGSWVYHQSDKLIVEIRERSRNNRIKRKEETKMEWQVILALALAIPVILFPVAFVWYLNIGGIYTAIKEAREKLAAREKGAGVEAKAK